MTTGPVWGPAGRMNVAKYQPKMATTDVLPAESVQVGGARHLMLIDLLDALESEEEEDMLRLLLHGWTQEQVAKELRVHQTTVSRRLKALVRRAA